MKKTIWKCHYCGQTWVHKPIRTNDKKLKDGQCDCGKYINTENAMLIEVE